MSTSVREIDLNVRINAMLNRALIYTVYPAGIPINFTVLFNRQNAGLQFEVSDNKAIREKKIRYQMFRNLRNCKFCQTFFELEYTEDDNNDYRGKFVGLKKVFESQVIKFQREKLDLHIGSRGKSTNNYLLVLGWKFVDIDDFMFFFVQRRVFHNITRTNIIRTAGVQFATEHGLNVLEKYYQHYIETFDKKFNISFLDEMDGGEIDLKKIVNDE